MNPYEVLGIPPTATEHQIKLAYRDKVKLTHPDVTKDDGAAFHLVGKAYTILSDPALRKSYDLTGSIDDNAVRHVQEHMLGILASLFSQAINHEVAQGTPMKRFDVMEAMRTNIRRIHDDKQAQLNGVRALITARLTLRGRIKRLGDEPNLFADMLEAQIADLRKAEDKTEVDHRATKMALDELSHYKTEVELVQAMQMNVYGAGPFNQQAGGGLYQFFNTSTSTT